MSSGISGATFSFFSKAYRLVGPMQTSPTPSYHIASKETDSTTITMPQSRNPQFRLNLGELDLTARITFTTNPHDTPMIGDFRVAAVKRYKGYLHDSMKCGFRSILARADHRSLNIACGHQALPSRRSKRLLKALPRLDTGSSPIPQWHEDSVPDNFSFCGGWERYVQRPSSPDDQDNFDWHSFMRADAEYALNSMQRYNEITEYNRVHLAKQDPAERAAREARQTKFFHSLDREVWGLEELVILMEAGKPEPGIIGTRPVRGEWRYSRAAEAIKEARDERRWRKVWAMQFSDTRLLILEQA